MNISSNDIDNCVRLLSKNIEGIESVYLFGSSITEFSSDSSDIDIAIKSKGKIEEKLLWDLKNQLADLFHRDTDLIDLTAADTVLQMQVVSTGKRIFTSDQNKSESWESLIYSMYLQLNDDRKYILDDIVKCGKIYG